MKITFTVLNPTKDSIYSRLQARLGRRPSVAEIRAEIHRIRREA